MTLTLDVDLPADLERFRLPDGVAARLQSLLDQQDAGKSLSLAPNAMRPRGWSIWPNFSLCCDYGQSE